jgi:hypothetical protein
VITTERVPGLSRRAPATPGRDRNQPDAVAGEGDVLRHQRAAGAGERGAVHLVPGDGDHLAVVVPLETHAGVDGGGHVQRAADEEDVGADGKQRGEPAGPQVRGQELPPGPGGDHERALRRQAIRAGEVVEALGWVAGDGLRGSGQVEVTLEPAP